MTRLDPTLVSTNASIRIPAAARIETLKRCIGCSVLGALSASGNIDQMARNHSFHLAVTNHRVSDGSESYQSVGVGEDLTRLECGENVTAEACDRIQQWN